MKEEKAIVYVKGTPAAVLTRHAQKGSRHYELQYLPEYLEQPTCHMVCYKMPPRQEPYYSEHLFPFFESLLPEGENLERICAELKLDEQDRFSQLLRLARHDTVGDVTVQEVIAE
ncbi:MAG: HipA N-terminal domain-containing protein [Akkermansia sp.]